ncbi:MAG: AraC family transcriptional regulator ligand-binding domain-containing protein, partial [Pseudomonadales bacterium]
MPKKNQHFQSVRLILRMLNAYDVDLKQLLRTQAIPYVGDDPVHGISLPISQAQYNGLESALSKAIGRDKKKFQSTNVFSPNHFRYMSYGLIHCRTLGEAIERSVQFFHLFAELGGTIALRQVSQDACFCISEEKSMLPRATNELNWHRLMMFYGWLVLRPIPLTQVQFPETLEREKLEKLAAVFQVPVSITGRDTRFIFDKWILSEPIRQ